MDPFNNTSLSFLIGVTVWNIRRDTWRLFFRILQSIFSNYFKNRIANTWEWFFQNRKSFLSITDPFKTTSLGFIISITILYFQMDHWTLFSRNSWGKISWIVFDLDATSSNSTWWSLSLAMNLKNSWYLNANRIRNFSICMYLRDTLYLFYFYHIVIKDKPKTCFIYCALYINKF